MRTSLEGRRMRQRRKDLEKALRTATNAAGAFYTVPCWMSSVTPPPPA
ncbi:hypothetical protein DUNSADRAFT_16991 [Dunaliella salina]|uniref:Encoded protein n=1 Tax=Dunaliella salina TaxID=3046 RepID=A0ABQ7G2K9_DUNSA|nr:hypothetical protein DUNSADRAFT_16991 [Dunaliella salina]|eukprot:KAF5828841.1 hypothetical protein DUNSADRAFT_16991 [Dunaliella salina]